MYLHARRSFWGTESSYRPQDKDIYEMLVKNLGLKEFESNDFPAIDVKFKVGYWRKENHIHRWFVENVQDGEDDCRSYELGKEELITLRDTCQQVIDHVKMEPGQLLSSVSYSSSGETRHYVEGGVIQDTSLAEELLPTQEGFFFGGTGYDEWYVRGCEETIEICNRALKMSDDWYFEYRSSW